MSANTNFPGGSHPGYCIPLIETRQVTVDIAFDAGPDILVPFPCRVVGVVGIGTVIGGSTVFTDVDLLVRKFDGSTGTNLVSAAIPVVDSSTLVGGGVEGVLSTTESDLTLAAGDRLQLDINITGGSTPTGDGIGALVFVVPLE